MKKLITLSSIALLISTLILPLDASAGRGGVRRKARALKSNTDELIVVYRESMSENQKNNSMQSVRGRRMGRQLRTERGMGHRVKVKPEEIDSAMQALQNDPNVMHVQKNFRYYATAVPNDPIYPQLWALKNRGQQVTANNGYADQPIATANPGTAGKDMNLELAWNTTTDCRNVIVAVIDTGLNYTHSELVGNVWDGGAAFPNHGFDFVDNDNNPQDLNGHGTHVAGTIGAAGNNGNLGTGVCWRSQIMGIRVLDASGAGSTADIAEGIAFAVEHGAKIINLSLGGPSGGAAQDLIFMDAIKKAGDAGVLVVAAAGNDGEDIDATPSYPCAFDLANMICVAALDQRYGLAGFSSYGAKGVDVGAPGVNVVSSWAGRSTFVADDFNNAGALDWTASSTTNTGWGYFRRLFPGLSANQLNALGVPGNWDGANQRYANSTDDRVYKAFSFNNALAIILDFFTIADTETNADFFSIHSREGTASPIGGTLLDRLSGSTGGDAVNLTYDITSCANKTCTVGFQLQSNAATNRTGVVLLGMGFSVLSADPASLNAISGTSMATPHVAGLAALVWATNPQYTWREVADAILRSGVNQASLAGKTTTGKSVDAAAAVAYIRAPTGVQAVVSQ